MDVVSIVESLQPFMTHSDPLIRGKGTETFFYIKYHQLLAAIVFKAAVNQKFEGLDVDSLNLLKNFTTQKLDDAAVVIESLAILKLFYQRKALNDSEMLSICIR